MSTLQNHFIKNLNFTNFKCFKDLEVNNIQRVNLIGGKNNVGKTSFMEGIELFVSSSECYELAYNIRKMVRRRQSNMRRDSYFELDFIYENNSILQMNIDNKNLKIEYIEETRKTNDDDFFKDDHLYEYNPSLKLKIDSDEKILSIDKILTRPMPIRREKYNTMGFNNNFIPSAKTEERDIAIYYGELINLNKEDFLNNSLKLFDENLVSLKQIATDRDIVLKVSLKNRELPILLSSLGEGINRYIAILCAIWVSKDGYLFIDEIENGIHYRNYKKLWKIIFEASYIANCQIFITTHSKECIEAFNEVNEDNNGSYFEFYRNQKTNLITAKHRDNNQLQYALTHDGEIRGE